MAAMTKANVHRFRHGRGTAGETGWVRLRNYGIQRATSGEVLFCLVSQVNKVRSHACQMQVDPATIDQMRENNRTSGIAVQVPEGLHGNPAASEPGGHRSSDGQGRQYAPAHTRRPYRICVISGAHWPQVLVQFSEF